MSVPQPHPALDAVFFALADGTRRALLERLRGTEETAGALARDFDVTRPAVSRHLRVLREAALVVDRRNGRERIYALDGERLSLATQYLDGYRVFWAARLRGLKDLVESLPDDALDAPSPPAASERSRKSAKKSPKSPKKKSPTRRSRSR